MHLQNKTFTANELMDVVLEEYNCLTLQDGRKGEKSSRTGKDAAFGADASKKGKGNHHKAKFDGNCNNCSWYRHKGCDCWEEGSEKAGQAPKMWKLQGKKSKDEKDKGKSANVCTHTTENQPDSAWLVISDHAEPHDTYSLAAQDDSSIPELYDSGASQHLSLCCEWFICKTLFFPQDVTVLQ